jgi:adenylyltransferase/sulfurtransferase
LRDDQVRRYARHVLLPDVGGTGQRRLFAAAVVVDELDAEAEVALVYLAAAGVGTVVVRDERPVTAPGWLFEAADVGRPRRAAARERIRALNPDVRVDFDGAGAPLAPGADGALTLLRRLCASST